MWHWSGWKLGWVVVVALVGGRGVGQSLTQVNGTDTYVDVPHQADLVSSQGITVEGWVTYNDVLGGTGNKWPSLLRKNVVPGQETYFIRVDAGTTSNRNLKWMVRTAVGTYSTTWTFATGALAGWTHVAATYDNTTLRLYINGNQVTTAAGNGPLFETSAQPLRIGKGDSSGGPIEVWNGSIDSLRIWPFARTQAEIQATMNIEFNGFPQGVSTWNLDGNTMDSSGTNHGTGFGTLNYGTSPPLLVPYSTSGLMVAGPGPTACPIRFSATALPIVGTADFNLIWTGAPANAGGVIVLGLTSLLPTHPLASGFGIWVDPFDPLTLLFPVSTAADGIGRANFPIPGDPLIAGITLYVQAAFATTSPACSSFGAIATDALAVTLLL